VRSWREYTTASSSLAREEDLNPDNIYIQNKTGEFEFLDRAIKLNHDGMNCRFYSTITWFARTDTTGRESLQTMIVKQIRSYLIAKSYDYAMGSTEKRCLQSWRRDLLAQASGDLLEIGAGTGVNIPHYPDGVERIILSEPDSQMRQRLQRRTDHFKQLRFRITPWEADTIEMPDASFDTIVSTLVLCSVPNLKTSLNEIYRLLKPNGSLLFLEHIISDHPTTRTWQHRFDPIWGFCAGNCHLTRDTESAIRATGLQIEQLIEAPMTGTPAFVRRTIRGVARKTSPRAGAV
jgi:ubiquinone/menaquinone biosynthesis C-methylase UbiE